MANNRRKNRRRAKKRNIMQEFTINRMAAVDVPAQEGATALILKRADTEPADSEESFINMVKASDWGGICATLTSDTGIEHASSCMVNMPDYQPPTVADNFMWSNGSGITFKFEPTPEEQLVEKLVLLTTSENDHQHAIRLDRWDLEEGGGSTSYQGGTPEGHHNHDYIINADGSIVIGESDGHTHEVEMSIIQRLQTVFAEKRAPKKGEPGYVDKDDDKSSKKAATDDGSETPTVEKSDMDEEEVQKMIDAALTKQAEDHQTELTKAQAIGELTDVQKAHYGSLSEDEQAGFLSLSPDQRQSAVDTAIEKRNAADPVVYKAADGTEYHKSDDDRLVTLAKRDDAREAEMTELRNTNETASLEKRAEALEFLPGTTESKVAMLKAIDGIPDEATRTASLEALNAQNESLEKAFTETGVRPGQVDLDSTQSAATSSLATLSKNYAKEHNVDEATAYGKVLETPEGERLYAQSVQ